MLSISMGSLEVLCEFHKVDDYWKRLIPLVRSIILLFRLTCVSLFQFCKQSSMARQNNTSGLKHKLSYVLHDPSQPLLLKIPDSSSKSDRGINHLMLCDAIIPWPLCIQINEKEVTDNEDTEPVVTAVATTALKALMRGKTVNKKPALTAKQDSYPSCFYTEGAFDPDDPEKGLFRSSSSYMDCTELCAARRQEGAMNVQHLNPRSNESHTRDVRLCLCAGLHAHINIQLDTSITTRSFLQMLLNYSRLMRQMCGLWKPSSG
ncbi:hypothetical protein K438DRAFT_1281400 [Mycena galopus ATCC 62051]|nr:hypothetical protein K438DRAFT_1281400 [Mycena galopus ATCC 62051]